MTLAIDCRSELDFEYVSQVIKNISNMLDIMEKAEKKTFYHMIISKILVKDKKIQEIQMKIPEAIQNEMLNKSLSNKKSDGDFFVHKNMLKFAI